MRPASPPIAPTRPRRRARNAAPRRGGESGSSDDVIFWWSRWAAAPLPAIPTDHRPSRSRRTRSRHSSRTPATAIRPQRQRHHSLAGARRPTIVDGSLAPGTLTGSARGRVRVRRPGSGSTSRSRSAGSPTAARPAAASPAVKLRRSDRQRRASPISAPAFRPPVLGAARPTGTCHPPVRSHSRVSTGASHLGFDYPDPESGIGPAARRTAPSARG